MVSKQITPFKDGIKKKSKNKVKSDDNATSYMKSYRKEVEARYKKKQERRKSRKISRRFLVDDSSSSDSSDDDNITKRSSVVPIIPSGPSRVGTLPSVHPLLPRVFRRGSLRRSLRRGSSALVPHMPRPGSLNRRSRLSSAKAPLPEIQVSYDERVRLYVCD